MSNFLYAVCFILLTLSDHFSSYNADPIQGGQYDEDNEAKWLVSYQKKGKNGTWQNSCGGSIINSEYIVTAAHCFVSLDKDKIKARDKKKREKTRIKDGDQKKREKTRIRVWDQKKREKTRIVIGTDDLNLPTISEFELKIDQVIVPKAYTKLEDRTLLADIAVIKLKDRIDLSKNREKYRLIHPFYPRDDEKTKYDDKEGFVAGFGVTWIEVVEGRNKIYESDRLRNILPVRLTNFECPKGVRCVEYPRPSINKKRGMCDGHSGGPLYYKDGNEFELVGVISYGPRNCDIRKNHHKVGKITFIPDYKDFLLTATGLNAQKTFTEMSVKDFEKSGVDYIVLPDQAKLARKYYAKKKPCPE